MSGPGAVPNVLTRPRRDDVRARVIEAASGLFTERGYAATTLTDVAAAAGFTKGAIYSNFGGKPELFVASLTGRFRNRAAGAVRDAVRTTGRPTVELARQLAELTVHDVWAVQLTEFALLARSDADVAAAYAELRRVQIEELRDQLAASAADLGLRPEADFEAAAVLLITALTGLALEHALHPLGMTTARIEAAFRQLITGLRP